MSFKKLLNQKQTVGCFWLSLGSLPLVEFSRDAGAQAVVFDAQHGLWQRDSLENALGLVRGHLIPLVRVADCDRFCISSALDAGAEGVIIPLIENAAQARAAVEYAHYPPFGSRSAGGVRPLRDFAANRKRADETTVVALMIETGKGLENLPEIVTTPGLDLIFIGTGDLSLSLGLDGDDPELEKAVQEIKRVCERAAVSCGIFTADVSQARMRRDQGFSLVVLSDDITANRMIYQDKLNEFETA